MRAIELREMVVEASLALARLDADRLEELAIFCAALNRDPAGLRIPERQEINRQARDASDEMAVFARVLEATRANLDVMNRLRELRGGQRGYQPRLARVSGEPWVSAENLDGDD